MTLAARGIAVGRRRGRFLGMSPALGLKRAYGLVARWAQRRTVRDVGYLLTYRVQAYAKRLAQNFNGSPSGMNGHENLNLNGELNADKALNGKGQLNGNMNGNTNAPSNGHTNGHVKISTHNSTNNHVRSRGNVNFDSPNTSSLFAFDHSTFIHDSNPPPILQSSSN